MTGHSPTGTLALAATIGARVRRERLAREWTLDRLAEAAGISRRQVVNVEQGEANPSIGTLLKLSDALAISLSSLVERPSTQMVTITRRGEGAELWSGADGGRGVLLVGTASPDIVELWEWRMLPGEQHVSVAHHRGTRELLHVHAGAVVLDVAGDRHTLEAGDAILFPGDAPHAYGNEGSEPAVFSLSVYEPQSGTDRGGRLIPSDAQAPARQIHRADEEH